MPAEPLEWVNTDDLLAATGARNCSKSGNEWTFSCVSGNHAHGDATPSAGMNATTSLWRCRSPACGLRGNAADYLVALKGFSRSEAMRVLQERYGGPMISAEPGALEAEVARIREVAGQEDPHRIPLYESEYLDRYAIHWPDDPVWSCDPMAYMYGRGFAARILNKWLIGYDDRSQRITIPVHDESGKLVGVKARAYREDVQPRYLTLGHQLGQALHRYTFHTYMKSLHVFGLHRAHENSCVVICEGELNAVALDQLGIDAVAVAGSEFSDRQRESIVRRFSEAVVYFDDDPAGRAGAQNVAEQLHSHMPVWIIRNAPGDAADAIHPEKDFSPQQLRQLLASPASFLLNSVLDSRVT